MNILITNWRLHTYGGTENWSRLMGSTLEKMGHEVTLSTKPMSSFDLALINHLDPRGVDAKRKVYTSHGVIPELEKPKPGADSYIGVSEETKNYHKLDHIIRNPIDVDRFRPEKPVNKTLKNILVISNNPIDHNLIEKATKDYNLTTIGGQNKVNNIEDYINRADLVITLGRGCYEAMACNRNVLVYDYNGGDGIINEENYYKFRKNNCSGRYNKLKWTSEELREQLSGYDPDLRLRKLIIKEHSPKKIAEEYLAI